ncbi:hypothetical protein P153DRAFT_91253 [Dothidotthia symphoricarpi CBS 119687]|uniref:F-box domain-containing protein n=1 Tax=Dothidotthia symphoricarpi CBS 119687 TaxID=1392245 RepID=A0A6A6A506_9PLEO|nr:uncharacterized protein P153DRAFT_91253 [Dothidotthia symphoricarpi CBS 119687]KAF2125681.1 hypothetical protein P153DRAFT_91253 [Dothidotthia symphoricarpi CBS 119687]
MFHLWDELPLELKLRVLEERLLLSRPLHPSTVENHVKRALLPLVLSNKEIRLLATEAFYSKNSFVARRFRRREYDEFPDISPFCYPNATIGPFVRKLEVHLIINTSISSVQGMLTSDLDWRYLLRPNEGVMPEPKRMKHESFNNAWTPQTTRWQDCLPNLLDLKIVLTVKASIRLLEKCTCMTLHGNGGMRTNPPLAADFPERLKHTHIPIRAKKVEVIVEGMDCDDWNVEHQQSEFGSRCADIVANTIRSKIQQFD